MRAAGCAGSCARNRPASANVISQASAARARPQSAKTVARPGSAGRVVAGHAQGHSQIFARRAAGRPSSAAIARSAVAHTQMHSLPLQLLEL